MKNERGAGGRVELLCIQVCSKMVFTKITHLNTSYQTKALQLRGVSAGKSHSLRRHEHVRQGAASRPEPQARSSFTEFLKREISFQRINHVYSSKNCSRMIFFLGRGSTKLHSKVNATSTSSSTSSPDASAAFLLSTVSDGRFASVLLCTHGASAHPWPQCAGGRLA